MMRIDVVEDSLTPWIDKTQKQVKGQAENILRYAMRNFYDNVLIEEVPYGQSPPHPSGYEGGSLLESGSEEFWIPMSSAEYVGFIMEFSGKQNPEKNRELGGWYDWLPDKAYGLYQYENGKQNTHWIEEPLEEHQSTIFTDMEDKYWEFLLKGAK